MISISNIPFRPAPTINITPEYFYDGPDIIGGYLVITLEGTYYADDEDDYDDIASRIILLNRSCVQLNFSAYCPPSSPDSNLFPRIDGTQAICKSAQISHGGGPLDLNYSITLECSKDNQKNSLFSTTSDACLTNDKAIISQRSYSVSYDFTNTSTFAVVSSDSGLQEIPFLAKVHGKLSGKADVSFYDNDQCDSNNIDYPVEAANYLRCYISKLIDNPKNYNIKIPDEYELSLYSSSLGVRSAGGSASFEAYAIPSSKEKGENGLTYAVVDFSTTQSTDQQTGFSTLSVKGSITGLDKGKAFMTPQMNASAQIDPLYQKLKKMNLFVDHKKYALDQECIPISNRASSISDSRYSNTCWAEISSSISESDNKLSFEIKYGHKDKLDLLGYQISTTYELKKPTEQVAEHIAPGRPSSLPKLLYNSRGKTAKKIKISTQGSLLPGCRGSQYSELVQKVTAEFNRQKTRYGITSSNLLRTSYTYVEAEKTYTMTEEYIQCQ